ncbi:MAG: hypothetical protein FWE42_09515 [Defluviitaleaceae bacterium]|nr:hypothetical protein [Defluviitaleaceae bacterium]
MKSAKRNTQKWAITCALAMAFVLTAFWPSAVFAAEADEPYTAAEMDYAAADDPAPNTVSVNITEETFFSFTPNTTGYWTFVTSNNTGDSSPRLSVVNHYGHVLATNSGTAQGGNAIVTLHLVEGAPYVIQAGAAWGSVGSYTLTVSVSDEFERPVRHVPTPVAIPGGGGFVRGHDRLLYTFTPETSGLWVFEAASTGLYVEIEIMDSHGNFIAGSMDEWATGFRATIRLVAGVEYTIRGWSDWDGVYTLDISPTDTFEPWIDWVMFAEWGITLDLDADREVLSPAGVEQSVNEEIHFSFTPDTTGPWLIGIEDSISDIFAIVTDTYGSFISVVEGSLWWGDWIVIDLEAGVEYVIWASSFWGENINFTLVVEPLDVREPDLDLDLDIDSSWGYVDDWRTRIPSGGGYFTLDNEYWFVFAPEETSSWSIQISGAGNSWSELDISDPSSSFWVRSNGSVISMHMAGGVDYTIEAWVGGSTSQAVLHVSPTYEIHVPNANVNAMRRITQEAEFSFVPAISGYWIIYTSQNVGATDPHLWLLDASGNILAQDDDGGEGLNALIKIRLEAGVEYVIRAGFFAGAGEYVLNVQMAGGAEAERELVVLLPPGA